MLPDDPSFLPISNFQFLLFLVFSARFPPHLSLHSVGTSSVDLFLYVRFLPCFYQDTCVLFARTFLLSYKQPAYNRRCMIYIMQSPLTRLRTASYP